MQRSGIELESLDATQLRELWKYMSGKSSKASKKTLIGYIRTQMKKGTLLPTFDEVFGSAETEIEIEEVELPTIEDIQEMQNPETGEKYTNLLPLKAKDLLVFRAEDCSPWLPNILESKRLFGGAEGDVYAYGNNLVKSEFYAGNPQYSIVFMNRLNKFLENGFPHFLRVYMVYKCESESRGSDRLITIMERGGKSLAEAKAESKKNLKEEELMSIFAQVMMIFTLFLYRGMNHFDLHDGNVLIEKTTYRKLSYTFGETTYTIPTYGNLVKIIDFGNVGFLTNKEDIFLSLPESMPGISDSRKYPFSFYRAGIDLFVGDFPTIPTKDLLLEEWKKNDILNYKTSEIKQYKRDTSFVLFNLTKDYFDFGSVRGKTKTTKIIDVGRIL